LRDLRCFNDSCTLGDVVFEIRDHDFRHFGFEVFEVGACKGGTIDLVVVDADVIGVVVCGWETLLHQR
jgi:hypothetical protein